MSSSSSKIIKAEELSSCVDDARNTLLRQCWLNAVRKYVSRLCIESIFNYLWVDNRPFRSFFAVLFTIVGVLTPVAARFYFNLGGLSRIVLEVYQWWIIGPQAVLLVIGVVSSPAKNTLRSCFQNHKWGAAIVAMLLTLFSVFLSIHYTLPKLGDALLSTWIWCVVGPVFVASCISLLTSTERYSQDRSKNSSSPRPLLSKNLAVCVILMATFWVVDFFLGFQNPPSWSGDLFDTLRWCLTDCVFIAVLIHLNSWLGDKVIEKWRKKIPMTKVLVGTIFLSAVLASWKIWCNLHWLVDALFTDIAHYSLGVIIVSASISSCDWFRKNELEEKDGGDKNNDHDEPVKWARLQFALLLFFAIYLTIAMLIVVWLSWKQAQEGHDGFQYVLVPAYLVATCLLVGTVVENLYVPLKRVSHVDIVCVSSFLKSTGWAMLPVPLILTVIGAFISNIGASDDKLAQVIGLSLTLLTWIASYLRQQRQRYVEYAEARGKIEAKLDALTPKTVIGILGERQNRVVLDYSEDKVDTLIRLAKEGVSIMYSNMPLIPVETLSLYLASRIYLWPVVRQNLADYWGLGEVSQMEGVGRSGTEICATFGRLIIEFEAMSPYMIKCIKGDLEYLMKHSSKKCPKDCSARILAIDILVRETI